MDLHLRGKRVLITGASKGIGAAAAEAFAEEGAHLLLAARSGDQLKALADRLRSAHQIDAATSIVDLRKEEDVARLAKEAADIDVLVNNAGDIPAGSLEILDDAASRRGFDLKVFGYITLSRLYYPRMKGKDGVIINIIGNSGENWDASYIAGSTGNAALMSFTKALGGRSLDHGVRVVAVNPGPVATDRMLKIMKRKAIDMLGDEGRWEELFDKYPGKRPATSEEVADLVAFLSSPRSGYITGTVVTIDGGIAARGSVI